ncbi:RagB/SusD family nutrient uptake outer membrane protein [Paraflavitalea sp. CAU 1676]|uniref:RagB/SusD family nutrient uptake outer membrane protein n=1 Tax=Paraflavitalea sp. CAU 1676 TaxID=3032598 RepID=UPI0023DAC3E1|nr:RagB/SusD family nutrient uptake outer membrane protein [Paraflavitalea sp. CAU 1676]MDF2192427.1 RagB/SusD family nutrient uptake outer membrane protein [Paraflavitalea sp. CAU 1676]
MRNRNIVMSALLISLLGAGCSKTALDITPEGTPTSGNFWKTEADAVKAANALYEQFDGEEFYGRGYMWYINASDDMVTGRSNAQAENIKNFNKAFNGGSYTRDQWKMRYIVIKRANDIILNVPKITMNEDLRKRILGEAYFLSGLMYFQLAYNYGDDKMGVPIVDRTKPEETLIPRAANVAANYAYIEQELLKAADLLPYFNELKPEDYGRAHKTAAWAFLAKTALYKKDWANAEKYAALVIASNKHDLVKPFKQAFTIANNWSPEYIWSALSNTRWGSILPGVMLENKGWGKYNGWGYYQPTKELYDSYEPGDQRREVTILKTGDKFLFWGDSVVYGSANSLTGYQFNKYMEPFGYKDGTQLNPDGNHPTTNLNVPLMRYAEVLLIMAEAKLMQNKNADAEINKVRARAGLTPLTNATMANLKRERRSELAGEWSNRHFDLVRWGDAKAAYAQPLHHLNGSIVWPARNFDPAIHHIWPVPQSAIDNGGGIIKQNFGW